MAQKKKFSGFGKLKKTTDKVKQEQVYVETNVEDLKQENRVGGRQRKKMGRPTWKDPNITYVRLSVDVPKDVRDDLKVLLYTKFKDTYISQDELINAAINEFLTKHS